MYIIKSGVDASTQDIQEINRREAVELCNWLIVSNGYRDARVLDDGSVAGLQDLLFTRAIATGCTRDGWCNRYCFENVALAEKRFAELRCEDDVPDGHVASRQGLQFVRRQGIKQ